MLFLHFSITFFTHLCVDDGDAAAPGMTAPDADAGPEVGGDPTADEETAKVKKGNVLLVGCGGLAF